MNGQLIGYIRVSSIDQNIDRQLDSIKLDKIFIDKCSGKDTNRPQLKLMLDFVREGDTVYVHSMDRLARNLDDLRKIVQQLTNFGIKIKFIKEGLEFINENSPMSVLLLSVMGAFAEFERSLIRERQLEGIALAKRAGKYRGRSNSLTNEQIEVLKQKVANRYKKTALAKEFGISRETLYRYLKST
jgi:DNA invertase Pin-like site-specific DNA recombinase